jgi:hypothetical protein
MRLLSMTAGRKKRVAVAGLLRIFAIFLAEEVA